MRARAPGILLAFFVALPVFSGDALASDDATRIGREIYVHGRLPSGVPLRATRGGEALEGRAAACIQCHRGSGLGQVEGEFAAPPVSGKALFGPARSVIVTMDRVRGKAMNVSHEPYSQSDFANLVRGGTRPDGRALHELMPRYALDEASLASLAAYLRTLSDAWSPGAFRDRVRFATVITPEVSAKRRKAFLDTLRAAVARKNANTMPGKRHMVSAAEFAMVTERKWELDVWELEGAPETWAAQLDARYASAPVFAVLSGLSESDWTPVHGFCERERVPCWFPSVRTLPDVAGDGAFGLYFHAGVSLEAGLLARHFLEQAQNDRPLRIVQMFEPGVAGRLAADAFRKAVAQSGILLEDRVLQGNAADALHTLSGSLRPRDALLLWMGSDALTALARVPAPASPVYFSALMSGSDGVSVPMAWRQRASVVYPYELPSRRANNLAYFRRWLAQSGVPLADEALQSEVYFSVTYLADTLSEMLDNLHRDYLVERAETMLSRRESRKAEDQARDSQMLRRFAPRAPAGGAAPGSPGTAVHAASAVLGSSEGTTIYPALGLGPGQRFASKGGYVIGLPALLASEGDSAAQWITNR